MLDKCMLFRASDIRRLVAHVKSSKKFSYYYWKNWTHPGLLLVGDRGIYMMSNGLPGLIIPDGSRHVCVYARGCDPSQDADWYERKRFLFGGDDGVEFFHLAKIEDMLADNQEYLAFELEDDPEGSTPESTSYIMSSAHCYVKALLENVDNVEAMRERNKERICLYLPSAVESTSEKERKRLLEEAKDDLSDSEMWLMREAFKKAPFEGTTRIDSSEKTE